MGRAGPQTQAKLQREQKKREKRLAKREKMALRRAQKQDGTGAIAAPREGELTP